MCLPQRSEFPDSARFTAPIHSCHCFPSLASSSLPSSWSSSLYLSPFSGSSASSLSLLELIAAGLACDAFGVVSAKVSVIVYLLLISQVYFIEISVHQKICSPKSRGLKPYRHCRFLPFGCPLGRCQCSRRPEVREEIVSRGYPPGDIIILLESVEKLQFHLRRQVRLFSADCAGELI